MQLFFIINNMIIRKVSYFKRDKLRYIFQKIVIKNLYNSLVFIIFMS